MSIKAKSIYIILLFSLAGFAKKPIPKPEQMDPVIDRVRELKDQVLDRKLQLKLVHSLIEQERLDTQYPLAKFDFVNKMSSRYLLQSIEYYIDENKVYSFFNDIDKLEKKESANQVAIESYAMNLSPGEHSLKVVAIYSGNDTGVFSYLSDYKVRSEESFRFQVERGRDVKLQILGYEKGNIFTDFKERPGLEITKN